MIKKPDSYKRYNSARSRFLKPVLVNFFRREFPRLLGPILCHRLVDELLKLLNGFLIPKETIEPGQVLWYAVDKSTRPDSPNYKLVPVVLTLIDQKDCEKLSKGTPMSDPPQAGFKFNCAYNTRSLFTRCFTLNA